LKRILIFGNSGSGKTTLAQRLCKEYQLAHLDLDTIAWQAAVSENKPPQRNALSKSKILIDSFCDTHSSWVIEGCYADLLNLVCDSANELIYMNLPIQLCVENAKNRKWEPHKYESKKAQDQNLEMLIEWIEHYDTREDTFSKVAHQSIYDGFDGEKRRIVSNREST